MSMSGSLTRGGDQYGRSVPLAFQDRAGGAVEELGWGECALFALSWQAASFALLAAQLVLVCALGAPAVLFGLVGMVGLFLYRPLSGVVVYFQLLLYQNLFLSIFSGWGIDSAGFTAVQGLSFGASAGMAAVAVLRIFGAYRRDSGPHRLTRWTCASLVAITLYTAYGMLGAPPVSALTYFRNTSAMLLALCVGLDVGRAWSFRTVLALFVLSLPAGLALSVAEYAVPHAYYTAIHARDYLHFRATEPDLPAIARSVDELISARVVRWFNITAGASDILSVRISGPNMLAVSYAYIIAAGGVAGTALGSPLVGLLALGLLVFAGVKGPLLLLALTLSIGVLWWQVRDSRVVLLVSLVIFIAYVTQALRIGLAKGDYHVIGFLGGVHGFLKMPWGHGIGVGGNLSATAVENLDWQAFQQSGADFALESAVGVLLYQMGVAAVAIYAPVLLLLKQGLAGLSAGASRLPGSPRLADFVFIGVAVTLANGVFQEEAYSPYILGVLLLFGGVVVANDAASGERLR